MAAIFDNLLDPALSSALQKGNIGVIPTDTVYGLACRANDPAAAKRLYGLKKRTRKPGTIIATNLDQLVSLGIKRSYVKAVERFWPGPVSVVIPFSDSAHSYLRQGLPDIAVRVIDDKKLATLIQETGPLLTTSANPPGKPPADTIQEAEVYFGATVDFYVSGPSLKGRKPSTVIRIVDDAVEVLRPGAAIIKDNAISEIKQT